MGGVGSGGYREKASQTSGSKISATGGAGVSGKQGPKAYTGMPYGENKALTEQQQGASMAATPEPTSAPADIFSGVRTLMDETNRPGEPVSAGVDFGAGPGTEVLPPSLGQDQRPIENMQLLQKYLPTLMEAGRTAEAPDTYKQFLNYLLKKMQ